jgi:hypothetical protein
LPYSTAGNAKAAAPLHPDVLLGLQRNLRQIKHAARKYFLWHHTPADTLGKVDPKELR